MAQKTKEADSLNKKQKAVNDRAQKTLVSIAAVREVLGCDKYYDIARPS